MPITITDWRQTLFRGMVSVIQFGGILHKKNHWIEEYSAIRPHDALEDLPPYQHAVAKP